MTIFNFTRDQKLLYLTTAVFKVFLTTFKFACKINSPQFSESPDWIVSCHLHTYEECVSKGKTKKKRKKGACVR